MEIIINKKPRDENGGIMEDTTDGDIVFNLVSGGNTQVFRRSVRVNMCMGQIEEKDRVFEVYKLLCKELEKLFKLLKQQVESETISVLVFGDSDMVTEIKPLAEDWRIE